MITKKLIIRLFTFTIIFIVNTIINHYDGLHYWTKEFEEQLEDAIEDEGYTIIETKSIAAFKISKPLFKNSLLNQAEVFYIKPINYRDTSSLVCNMIYRGDHVKFIQIKFNNCSQSKIQILKQKIQNEFPVYEIDWIINE